VLRWLEQVEIKHCEFIRLIRSMEFTSLAWRSWATKGQGHQGHQAYALKQAAVYDTLRKDAVLAFRQNSEPDIMGEHSVYEHITLVEILPKIASYRDSVLRSASITLNLTDADVF
jgi:hypothetical protein